MTLLRHVVLVSGLLLGVSYAAASYVETRQPLSAAPQVAEQGSLDSDGADAGQVPVFERRSFSTRENAASAEVPVTAEA